MKHIALILSALALCIPSAFGQIPPPAAPNAGGDRYATEIGRLFNTPEQRAALERQRQLDIRETQAMPGETMQLNGIVRRKGKPSTVWINNQPQTDKTRDAPVGVQLDPRDPTRARLSSGGEAPVDLRVGESVNRITQERNDVVAPNAVRVEKPRKR